MADWLKPIKNGWMSVIKEAVKYKNTEFQKDADEAMRFFNGPYDFLYNSKLREGDADDEDFATPTFHMTFNKVAEAVQLFGPTLYHRNPYRQVNPAQAPPVPMVDQNDPQAQLMMQAFQQQQLQRGSRVEMLASLMGYVLNYTPNELDLRGQSRQVVDECLIKGMGVWWTAPFRPPGSPITLIGSFYDSIDNLVIDPDMESIEHAKWIARKRVFPVWEVERRFQLPEGTLRGSIESRQNQSQRDESGYKDMHRRGQTNDLFTYWEVYSRMGLGHRMAIEPSRGLEAMKPTLDKFGEHCFLAVSDDYDCPLNLPEYAQETMTFDDAFMRCQWPTPHWAEHTNPWPFTYVAFHKVPRKVWPMSHMKPGMGEIKFLNWAFSFIADKIKNTSRDFIAVQKGIGEELKSAILSGKDLTLLEIESLHGKSIQDVVSFLQHPQFNGDVYRVIDVMMNLLDKRLGLSELMYGEQSKQDRSATISQIKGDQIRVRVDDMAECVEASQTTLARKEAMAWRWHGTPEDVALIVGPLQAQMWGEIVQQSDPYQIVLEVDYRIESGSIRKPNRQRDMENANTALQQWGPPIMQYVSATGNVAPLNALAEMWCKAMDYPPEKLRFDPPPPPQPDPTKMAELAMKAQGEERKMLLEISKAQTMLQLKGAEIQAKIAADERKTQLELEAKAIEADQEMALREAEAEQDLAMQEAEHRQDMRQDQQSFLLDMLQMRQEHSLDMIQKKAEGDLALKQAKAQAAAKPKPASSTKK